MSNQVSRSLQDRVAIITGASSGIGQATAKALAARGAKVVVIARRKERLASLAAGIEKAGGIALTLALDVTDKAAVDAAAATVLEKFGRVDIVINNAGIMLPNPIVEVHADQWKSQIDLNITGLMNVIGAFTPSLVKAGAGSTPADLVNISSIAARILIPNFGVYSATKAFVTHLSASLRTELGPKGVRVSAIEPGIVDTELIDHIDHPGTQQNFANSKTQIEWLKPEDVAEVIAYTVSAPKRLNMQQITIMPTGQV